MCCERLVLEASINLHLACRLVVGYVNDVGLGLRFQMHPNVDKYNFLVRCKYNVSATGSINN